MVGVAAQGVAVAEGSPVIVLLTGGSGSLATPLRQLCRANVGGDVLLSIGEPDFRPG